MSAEEKRKALAEMKALREAKAKQIETLAAAALASSTAASPPRTHTTAAAQEERGLLTSPSHHRTEHDPLHQHQNPQNFTSPTQLTLVSAVGEVDIPPRPPTPVECYARGTETEHVYVYQESRPHPSEVVSKEEVNSLLALQSSRGDGDDEQSPSRRPNNNNNRNAVGGGVGGASFWDKTRSKATSKLLSSRPFMDFMTKAVDTLDEFYQNEMAGGAAGAFAAAGGASMLDANALAGTKAVVTPKLVKRLTLTEPNLCKGRVVTDVAFQPGTSDSFVVALSAPSTDAAMGTSSASSGGGATAGAEGNASTGLVLLFHSRRQGQPPLQFHCEHEVRCVRFSRFHDHLLIGGTSTGRIVSWYVHQGPQPAMISFPLPDSHSTSIVQLWIRGDTNASHLVTLSQDGKLCTWTPETLRRPATVRSCVLERDQAPGRCAVRSADLQDSARRLAVDTSAAKLYLGAADGTLFETLHRASHRTLEMKGVSEAQRHRNIVTAVHCHPAHTDPRIGELVLTASLDGTCRLWLGSDSVALEAFGEQYVHDIKWSPVSPSVCATADGSGRILLWNFCTSVAPIAAVSVEPNDAVRLQWDDSGEHLLVGTSQGDVVVVDVTDAAPNAVEASKAFSEWVSQKFAAAKE